MKKRPHYDDEYRASAVLMLEAAGYPGQEGALSRVSDRLGVARSTLRSWADGSHNPPPAKIRHEKKRDFIADLQHLLGLHIDAATEVVGDSGDLRAIDTGIGILVDKIQLLTGQPTERAEVNVNDHRERLLADLARKSTSLVARDAGGVYTRPIG